MAGGVERLSADGPAAEVRIAVAGVRQHRNPDRHRGLSLADVVGPGPGGAPRCVVVEQGLAVGQGRIAGSAARDADAAEFQGRRLDAGRSSGQGSKSGGNKGEVHVECVCVREMKARELL